MRELVVSEHEGVDLEHVCNLITSEIVKIKVGSRPEKAVTFVPCYTTSGCANFEEDVSSLPSMTSWSGKEAAIMWIGSKFRNIEDSFVVESLLVFLCECTPDQVQQIYSSKSGDSSSATWEDLCENIAKTSTFDCNLLKSSPVDHSLSTGIELDFFLSLVSCHKAAFVIRSYAMLALTSLCVLCNTLGYSRKFDSQVISSFKKLKPIKKELLDILQLPTEKCSTASAESLGLSTVQPAENDIALCYKVEMTKKWFLILGDLIDSTISFQVCSKSTIKNMLRFMTYTSEKNFQRFNISKFVELLVNTCNAIDQSAGFIHLILMEFKKVHATENFRESARDTCSRWLVDHCKSNHINKVVDEWRQRTQDIVQNEFLLTKNEKFLQSTLRKISYVYGNLVFFQMFAIYLLQESPEYQEKYCEKENGIVPKRLSTINLPNKKLKKFMNCIDTCLTKSFFARTEFFFRNFKDSVTLTAHQKQSASWAVIGQSLGSDFIPLLKQLFEVDGKIHRTRAKIPKGCVDHHPNEMRIRNAIFNLIRDRFLVFGGKEIDTPVFELKESLTQKYGEESKLIYDLEDQGGEQLSLRYDLTVPFARYMGSSNLEKFKRFHIGKVYRRDEPQFQKGRFREFYQCDFDIAGNNHGPMIPEVEIITLTIDVLSHLEKFAGKFRIRINHRKLLEAILLACGVRRDKIKTACSSIDKLDKLSWEDVSEELCLVKDFDKNVVDRLKKFLFLRGEPMELLTKLEADEILGHFTNDSKELESSLSELKLFFSYCEKFKTIRYLSLDLCLARGLDYYTGLIYEAVLDTSDYGEVGSIAAGGRYDNLIGMFSNKQITAIGVSFGVERLFKILMTKLSSETKQRENKKQVPSNFPWCLGFPLVYVCHQGNELFTEKVKLCMQLRKSGIASDYLYNSKAKLSKQLRDANENKSPLVVILGEKEFKEGFLHLRKFTYLNTKSLIDGNEKNERKVSRESLISTLKEELDQLSVGILRDKES